MSPAIQWVVTIFMILSGVNYSMYFLILRKKFKQALSMEEIRLYFFVIVVAVVAISINISNMYPTMSETVRTASFQVGTLITSTGFATTDYDMWP
jgi:trk system potassium uptake protein TrkH